ncbi:MAG: glutathione S-transferase family protein [Polyangiales bacterium]|jgi:glutathione S-transferase
MTDASIILHTFALSHFCENARWALDYKRIPYTEESWAPMLHIFRTWRLKRTYTPVLRIDGKVIQESAEICKYVEERFPAPRLIPAEHREAVLRASDEARSLGPHVRRVAYFAIGQDLARLKEAWTLNVSSAEARLHKLIFPLSRRMAFKALRVNYKDAKESEALVRRFLADQDDRFDGGRYLVGETFTLADLTMASMLSPIARPPEHPYYPRMALGDAGDALVDSFRNYRMLDWVKRCYALHRV